MELNQDERIGASGAADEWGNLKTASPTKQQRACASGGVFNFWPASPEGIPQGWVLRIWLDCGPTQMRQRQCSFSIWQRGHQAIYLAATHLQLPSVWLRLFHEGSMAATHERKSHCEALWIDKPTQPPGPATTFVTCCRQQADRVLGLALLAAALLVAAQKSEQESGLHSTPPSAADLGLPADCECRAISSCLMTCLDSQPQPAPARPALPASPCLTQLTCSTTAARHC